jgi:hypothetical protein
MGIPYGKAASASAKVFPMCHNVYLDKDTLVDEVIRRLCAEDSLYVNAEICAIFRDLINDCCSITNREFPHRLDDGKTNRKVMYCNAVKLISAIGVKQPDCNTCKNGSQYRISGVALALSDDIKLCKDCRQTAQTVLNALGTTDIRGCGLNKAYISCYNVITELVNFAINIVKISQLDAENIVWKLHQIKTVLNKP